MAWTKKIATKDGAARYKVFFYDPSGAQRSKTFTKSEDARRFERAVEVRIDEGEYIDPALARITFREFWPRFLEASPHLRPSTIALYTGLMRHYVMPEFGERRLASIRPLDVSAFVAKLTERGVGDATTSAAFRLLRTVCGRAELAGIIARNPTRGVKTPKTVTGEMHFASAEEVAQLADAIGERYAALVYVLAYAGLRIGEAAALHITDLDLLRGRVIVSKAATEVNGHLAIGPTKTGSTRTVSLPAFLRTMLARHIERGFTADDGSVFSAPEGGPLRPRNFRRRAFAPAVRTAALPEGFRIHDLRHTCAALLIAQGAGPKEIASRLGHSSPVVTMTVYAHVLPSLDVRLTDGLEETFRATSAQRS
jgi:integrase